MDIRMHGLQKKTYPTDFLCLFTKENISNWFLVFVPHEAKKKENKLL